MAKGYSEDLRLKVIKKYQTTKGITHKEIADMFDIGIATFRRWLKLLKDTGNLATKKPQATRPRFVNYDKIAEYIKNNPDKIQKEIGKEFGYKEKAVCYILKKLNITYKKKTFIRGKGRKLKE